MVTIPTCLLITFITELELRNKQNEKKGRSLIKNLNLFRLATTIYDNETKITLHSMGTHTTSLFIYFII